MVLEKNVPIFNWEWGRNSAPREGQKIPWNMTFYLGLLYLLFLKVGLEYILSSDPLT